MEGVLQSPSVTSLATRRLLVPVRRRFFRSADRRGAGPRRAAALVRHNSAPEMRREHAERGSIVQLRLHDLFLLRASRFKSSARTCLVFGHPRQQSFTEAAVQIDSAFAPALIVAQREESSFGRSRIA